MGGQGLGQTGVCACLWGLMEKVTGGAWRWATGEGKVLLCAAARSTGLFVNVTYCALIEITDMYCREQNQNKTGRIAKKLLCRVIILLLQKNKKSYF